MIIDLRPANGGRRYFVTYLIDWAQISALIWDYKHESRAFGCHNKDVKTFLCWHRDIPGKLEPYVAPCFARHPYYTKF